MKFSVRVPQDVVATGGKCSLLKWVTGTSYFFFPTVFYSVCFLNVLLSHFTLQVILRELCKSQNYYIELVSVYEYKEKEKEKQVSYQKRKKETNIWN